MEDSKSSIVEVDRLNPRRRHASLASDLGSRGTRDRVRARRRRSRGCRASRSRPSRTRPGEDSPILTLAEVERRHIIATLERLGDNRKATAKALGVGENTLWRRLKSYGLVRERPKS
ncbi:MAG: hypothetical protein GXP55_22120 [Deltaproteobacteria bacterium]|nr:hypothetical protein [Deltaproteobacteria bacterium]